MTILIHEAETREEAALFLAEAVANDLKQLSASRTGPVTLLLSGGSTPAPAYKALAKADMDWSRVSVGLVDDRWVDDKNPASNAKLVSESFLNEGASAACFVPMYKDGHSAVQAASDVDAEYAPFSSPDIVILGMGPDGHTASWFPDSMGLENAMSAGAKANVAAIDATGCAVAGNLTERMTITMPVLLNASRIFLLISGQEKRQVLEEQSKQLPVHRLIGQLTRPMEVVWTP